MKNFFERVGRGEGMAVFGLVVWILAGIEAGLFGICGLGIIPAFLQQGGILASLGMERTGVWWLPVWLMVATVVLIGGQIGYGWWLARQDKSFGEKGRKWQAWSVLVVVGFVVVFNILIGAIAASLILPLYGVLGSF